MPTYDYECLGDPSCGPFELRQNMSDERLTHCPMCKAECRRRIGRGAGVIFKGTGFYCTDYKPKAKPTKPEGECL